LPFGGSVEGPNQPTSSHPIEKKALRCILRVSRDNARIPMQWEEGANRGFSSAPAWIRSPREDPDHSAAAESKKTDSVLSFYKECLSFRAGKNRNVFLHGDFRPLFIESDKLWAYERSDREKSYVVLGNFSPEPVNNPFPDESIVLRNVPIFGSALPPYSFGLFSIKK
jgi:glycosidase